MMSVEQSVEWELVGETEVLGKNLPQCHFVHHNSPHDLAWAWTRTAGVGSRRLTAWAMARPSVLLSQIRIHSIYKPRWTAAWRRNVFLPHDSGSQRLQHCHGLHIMLHIGLRHGNCTAYFPQNFQRLNICMLWHFSRPVYTVIIINCFVKTEHQTSTPPLSLRDCSVEGNSDLV
jgi:hypothetical protein